MAMLFAGIADSAAQSVVDRSFASGMAPPTTPLVSAVPVPLDDGGVILRSRTYAGVGAYESFDRHTASGAINPAFPRYAYKPGLNPGGSVVAVLRDGTYFMTEAPYRRNSDGTPVDAFVLGVGLTAGGDAVQVTLQPDGRLLIGQGTLLVRVLASGPRDASFDAHGGFLDAITQIELDAQGRVLVASRTSDATAWRLERLTANGAADPTFAPIVSNDPFRFTVLNDGLVVIRKTAAGALSSYVHYRSDGSFDAAWDLERWSGTILIAPDGRAYVTHSGLVYRLNAGPTSRVDPEFVAQADADVTGLALEGTQLYLAGNFASVDGWPTAAIARLDTTKISAPAASQLPRLTNVSGRARIGVGEDVAIAGFVIDSPMAGARMGVVLRGVGPGLDAFALSQRLSDPQLSLRDAVGAEVSANDNWADTPDNRNSMQQAGAFALVAGSKDAVIVRNMAKGAATLVLSSTTTESGVGLAELYDANSGAEPALGELANLSLRGHVGAGDDTLIAGFVISDPLGFGRKLKVLVRAVGPTLSGYGIAKPLADPKLTLYNAAGAPIATNDNWSDSANADEIAAAAEQARTFPLPTNSKDAAVILDLAPGTYTAQATPASGSEGVGLIEIYRLR